LPRRNVSGSVRTELNEAGELQVSVRDSGPGIDPEALERVFQPFYTSKDTGLGMGLSICRTLIEAHDGRLWASANLPHGAVFTFTLPLAQTRTNTERPADD
jgi:signal transduction histidine kinase